MSTGDISDSKLGEMYHRYVGEPASRRDIYGYWLFLLGSVVGLLGVLVYQVEQALFPGDLAIREIAIILAASGLAVTMFAIVVLLPVRRRGMQASVVGLLVSFAGVVAFYYVYPGAWYFEPDYTAEVIALYTVGVAIIVGVAVLVPIVTGEKGLLVEPELGLSSDEPPILLGDTTRDAFFTVYETPNNEWTWRTIQRDAVGQSAQTAPTDTDARMQVEGIREKIAGAGLLDITTAAFRLYQTEDDSWRWSLVTEDGGIIAQNDNSYGDRDAIESVVNFLKEETAGADVVEIRGAAFDIHEDEGGRWHWRLVDDRRRSLATSVDSYASEDRAETGTSRFVEGLENPRVLALETVGIELFEDSGEWRWRVIDGDDHHLVTSEARFDSRGRTEAAATDVAEQLSNAALIEYGVPGYEVYQLGDGWRWRLRDSADDIVATQYGRSEIDGDSAAGAERTRAVVGDADIIEFEGADYEVYPADDAWHWRLVSAKREVLAGSTEAYTDREAAEDAADRVREQALEAELIEFEQAAFQQYESDGEWRWRLIDEDGQVMADSGESYEDKSEVMEGMRTLKENAPDAEVLEIETAAFEIYLAETGEYAWRLIDEGGQLIAESAGKHPSRAAARDAVEFLINNVDEAAVRPMERAAFQLFSDGDNWGFWLVDTDGRRLAESPAEYPTYDDATGAIDEVREAGDDSTVDLLGAVTVQLRNGSGGRWRLIDRDRELIADGDRTYEDREEALDDVERLLENADDAPVFDIGRGVVWVDRVSETNGDNGDDSGGWRWRLVDEERTELAASPDTYGSQSAVMEDIETVQSRAPEAETFDIETLAFEPYRTEDGDSWRWRLLDETESVLAVSTVTYEHRDALTDAIKEVRGTTSEASILEIDEVTFEFAERGDGWIWRLIDENGSSLAESVQPHKTRQAAREEMLVVKEHAPEGETVVAW